MEPQVLKPSIGEGPVLEKQLKVILYLVTSIFSTEELTSLAPAEASRILGSCSRAAQHPKQLGMGRN